jgi:hypothetical protein
MNVPFSIMTLSGGVFMAKIAGREWYAAALFLGLGANSALLLAQHHAGRGLMAAVRGSAVPAERLELRQNASWHAHRSDVWRSASVGVVFAMVVC